jgi:hypothetical protein
MQGVNMKLRIKGNSLRLRVTRSELNRLIDTGRIEETIHLGPSEPLKLTYVLKYEPQLKSTALRYQSPEVAVLLSTEEVKIWACTAQVGIYATIDIGHAGTVDVIVEKDFACLDRSDADNLDTFANPNAGAICP